MYSVAIQQEISRSYSYSYHVRIATKLTFQVVGPEYSMLAILYADHFYSFTLLFTQKHVYKNPEGPKFIHLSMKYRMPACRF